MKEQKKIAYKKPQLIAKNNPQGSYAAGCPTESRPGGTLCSGACELLN